MPKKKKKDRKKKKSNGRTLPQTHRSSKASFVRTNFDSDSLAGVWDRIGNGICPECNVPIEEVADYANPDGIIFKHRLGADDKIHMLGSDEFMNLALLGSLGEPLSVFDLQLNLPDSNPISKTIQIDETHPSFPATINLKKFGDVTFPGDMAIWVVESGLIDEFDDYTMDLLKRKQHGNWFAPFAETHSAPDNVHQAIKEFPAFMNEFDKQFQILPMRITITE